MGRAPRAPCDVAVVIPCFNLGAYLPETVDSVQRQTRPPLETIIVDDGSDDPATLSCLVECAALPGVTVIRASHRGASLARNLGIERSRARYVLPLDADDILLPRFLEATVAQIEKSAEVGVVATWVELFGTMSGIWRPAVRPAASFLWQNQIANSSLLRRECWEQAGGYKDLRGCQDWELWLSIIVDNGWRWDVVPEVLFRYRRRPGSISEYREAHRPELLRQLVAFHAEAYRTHVAELFVEADTELHQLQRRADGQRRSGNLLQRAVRYGGGYAWRWAVRRRLLRLG